MKRMNLIYELSYQSYKFNRDTSPMVSLEQWGLIYQDIETLEARYQTDLEAEADRAKAEKAANPGRMIDAVEIMLEDR